MNIRICTWILFVLCAPFYGFESLDQGQKARICLNMIVKDESHVIQRALSSVKDVIDYWVIVDTGSSDGTQDLICEELKQIPGELYERPWQNFGYNRTEALRLAKGKADYILFLDADDWIDWSPGFFLPQSGADMYWARWQSRHLPSFFYLKPLIVKDSLFCEWEGVIHEYITCNHANSQKILDGVTYVFTSEGHRSKNPQKFTEAAQVLEEALQKDPDNSRYMFYLAESYRDANNPERALDAYAKRVGMGGWTEEIFWSLLQCGHLKKNLKYPEETILSCYRQAQRQNPNRSEPVYYIAELYNQQGNYSLAYDEIKRWQSAPHVNPNDLLFHMGWIDDYGLQFQLSIAAFYQKQYQESLQLHDLLLANPHLPESLRNQVVINRVYPLWYVGTEAQ